MTILFAASELEAFKITSTTDITGVTDAAEIDTTVARAGVRSQQRAIASVDFTPEDKGWAHFKVSHDDPDGAITFYVRFVDSLSGDAGVFRLAGGFNNAQAQLLTGQPDTWAGAGADGVPSGQPSIIDHQASNIPLTQQWDYSGIFPHKGTITFDFNWQMGGAGEFFEWFINGVSVVRFDGDTTPFSNTNIDRIEFMNGELTNDGATYSEVIVTKEEDTRGMRVVTLPPEADGGTNTAWTGDVTDIDETALDDGDLISSNTTGQIEQFGFSGFTMPTDGWDVAAVVVGFRGQDDAAGVQQVRASVRTGGSDFNGATQAMPATFEGFYEVFEDNPDTGQPWTAAEVDALEYGVESIT